ncbi:MAG TPA: entericidin A/B family lipoprotein [Methylophilaceae bacterium]|nr:entericidin A/B family lipoprotein [Methylophilaceae bacterium]
MKKLIALMLLVSAVVLTGCNTVNGVGKDLEAAGEAVQRNSK